jgi:hypothetical protein
VVTGQSFKGLNSIVSTDVGDKGDFHGLNPAYISINLL